MFYLIFLIHNEAAVSFWHNIINSTHFNNHLLLFM